MQRGERASRIEFEHRARSEPTATGCGAAYVAVARLNRCRIGITAVGSQEAAGDLYRATAVSVKTVPWSADPPDGPPTEASAAGLMDTAMRIRAVAAGQGMQHAQRASAVEREDDSEPVEPPTDAEPTRSPSELRMSGPCGYAFVTAGKAVRRRSAPVESSVKIVPAPKAPPNFVVPYQRPSALWTTPPAGWRHRGRC